ncbi:MAG: tetratricopeptide repeat protein [Candidatus Tectomicrobia bacterium]|nr:tetratricopeptide repeat protein [Candidatus Tectomicrobia bacterium]
MLLKLLLVSFLIGVGIACVLFLIMRSRRPHPPGPAGGETGLDADLISEDDALRAEASGWEEPRRGPEAELPRTFSAPGAPAEDQLYSGPAAPATREPAPSRPATARPPRRDAKPPGSLPPRPPGRIPSELLGDEGFSEARLIESDSPLLAGERERASGEPRPQADLLDLWAKPRELAMRHGLADPPLLDAWRPLGPVPGESGREADAASAGVNLPESFAAAWKKTAGAIDEEERKGSRTPPEIHYDLALLSYYAGEFEPTVAYLQMALDAGFNPARSQNLLGLTYYRQGFEAEAETRLKEATRARHASPQDRAIILTNLGLVATYRRAPDDALGYYGSALEVYRQLGDRQGQAETLSRMGRLCRAKHSPYEASKRHHEALELWRKLGDRSKEVLELRLLAAVFREKGDYTSSLDLSQRALAMNREMGDKYEEAINLGNIGLIYSLEKDLSKALEHFRAALSLHQQVGNLRGEANNLGNIGNILFLQGKTEEALESYRHALRINREIDYRWGEAVDLGNIGKIEIFENNLAAAGASLGEAHRIFTELNAVAQAESIRQALDQIRAHIPPEP